MHVNSLSAIIPFAWLQISVHFVPHLSLSLFLPSLFAFFSNQPGSLVKGTFARRALDRFSQAGTRYAYVTPFEFISRASNFFA